MLSSTELVPVLSWLLQRRRSKRCAAAVTPRHPLIELAGAAIGVWAALASGSPEQAALTALLGWQLLLIGLIDGETQWLPDRLTLTLLASGVLAALVLHPTTLPDALINALIGALAGYATLAAVRFAYLKIRGREGLGDGDPILFAAAGAWVGWIGLPSTLLWACAAGS